MDRLIFIIIGTLGTALYFSATCFIIGLGFDFFANLAPYLFLIGAAVGAYNGLTITINEEAI